MEIRKIAYGEKVTEPGIYDMPINWYHDDCCDGPSVSSSGLRTIELESPEHYWAHHPANPDRPNGLIWGIGTTISATCKPTKTVLLCSVFPCRP